MEGRPTSVENWPRPDVAEVAAEVTRRIDKADSSRIWLAAVLRYKLLTF